MCVHETSSKLVFSPSFCPHAQTYVALDNKNISYKKHYVLLMVKLHNRKLNQFYNRTIVYRNILMKEKALEILSISMNNCSILHVKEERVLCLVNDLQKTDNSNRIDKYWIDGILCAMTIVKKNGHYNYMYIVTELDTLESSGQTNFKVTLGEEGLLYLEELEDCWILRDEYYKL